MLTPVLTIDEVAARLGVDRDAVSRFIANKELKAINVTRDRNARRPSWRIRPEDLEAFELSRLSIQSPNAGSTKRKLLKKPSAAKRAWF
ncbi:helix-turn-helix domain-containing protein [Schlesneria sp. T3-172]|uniref:helix-turn-helix domain-containing protein n=1 Tax=Schlesneria sphaerica TaxID=3373610 RepID=UPI0037CA9FA2